jgi:glycosyltransferase involved in cell wall biosynthesis
MPILQLPNRHRAAVVIPVYNHEQMVADVVERSLKLGFPVIVVDDGSTDGTYDQIKRIEGIRLLRHRSNRGKDADGQHNPEDAQTLIDAIPANARPIIVGKREGMFGADVPWTSRFGREFSNFWVRMSGGPVVADSQSGFRAYPLPECLHLDVVARRFQFEVEVLVKATWSHMPVIEAPVRVSYTPGRRRVSHFHPFFDFLRNTGLFSRLITYRVLTLPFRGH